MSTTSLFERLLSICGKRYDDPDVIALHAEEGLGRPPTSPDLHTPVTVSNKSKGYQLSYTAVLKRPETWPPRLAAGGFATYVQSVLLRSSFGECLPEPFVIGMDEARAKELAISSGRSRVTHLHTVYRLFERGERSLQILFGTLTPKMSLTIDELADDDPRLEKFSDEAKTALQKQADRLVTPAKSERSFPRRRGVPKAEPLPPVLLELRAAFEAWYQQKPERTPSEHDYIDFMMHAQRDVSFITGWTENPGHEAEFYVFGADGQGSGVAFWLVHDAPLTEQPVVFLGSEGEGDVRPVAKDFPDFLELLAVGLGPREAPDPIAPEIPPEPLHGVRAILNEHFPAHVSRSPEEIVNEATRKFGDIEARMLELSYKP
jgi:hypothetical protein